MKIFWSRCSRFSYIINAKTEDEMSKSELDFVANHGNECDRCAQYHETDYGINLLRSCQIEPIISNGFNDRVIRLARVSLRKTAFSYWSPALAGATIAGLAVLAVVQLVSKPNQLPVFRATGEARKVHSPMFPTPDSPGHANRVQ